MNFWEIIIPVMILGLPLAAIAALALWSPQVKSLENKTAYLLYGLMLLASVLGFFQFQQPFTLALETGLPVSSSEFELALTFDPIRVSWVFFSSLVLMGMAFFDGASIYQDSGRNLRFIFLAGASLFSSMAFLSEKMVLSIMFIEITVFLLHSFSIQSGGDEGRLDRVSYFKRGSFIFLGLSAMLILSAVDDFNMSAIVLMGVVLYMMSLVFAKHNYLDWQYLPLSLLQSGAAFFLLGRLMKAEMAPELWLPLSVLFAVASLVFSSLSLSSLSGLNSHFWLTSSLVGYLLFHRFLSPEPFSQRWSLHESSSLLCVFSLANLSRYGFQMSSLPKRIVSVIFAILLLGVMFGVLPGINLPRPSLEAGVWRLALQGLLTYLLAAAGAKAVVVAFKAKASLQKGGDPSLVGWVPAVSTLVVFLVFGLGRDFNPDEFLATYSVDYFADSAWIGVAASMLAGVATGLLLGTNEKFLSWSKNRQKRMEDFVPRVDPIVIRWNQLIVALPERIVSLVVERVAGTGEKVAGFLSMLDKKSFGTALPGVVTNYSGAVSQFVRLFHSGSLRFYIYFGTVLAVLSAGFFLRGAL